MFNRYPYLIPLTLLALLAVFLCLVNDILFPFIVSLIIAYFLYPVIARLHSLGVSRTLATLGIISLFFIILTTFVLILGPSLYQEAIVLADRIPEYMHTAEKELFSKLRHFLNRLSPNIMDKINANLGTFGSYAFSLLFTFSKNFWHSGITLLNVLSLIFITPIITFYILRDWNTLVTSIHRLLPPNLSPVVCEHIHHIDRTLSGYFRGQLSICFFATVYYTTCLSILGIDFSLLIGIVSGVCTFIPYVGVFFGMASSLLVAFLQFGDLAHLGLVVCIFVLWQIAEGTFIVPILIGDKIGLHPVWVMFGMLAGASLFGFTGVLLAIPVSAVIGVFVRLGTARYLSCDLFTKSPPSPPSANV